MLWWGCCSYQDDNAFLPFIGGQKDFRWLFCSHWSHVGLLSSNVSSPVTGRLSWSGIWSKTSWIIWTITWDCWQIYWDFLILFRDILSPSLCSILSIFKSYFRLWCFLQFCDSYNFLGYLFAQYGWVNCIYVFKYRPRHTFCRIFLSFPGWSVSGLFGCYLHALFRVWAGEKNPLLSPLLLFYSVSSSSLVFPISSAFTSF